MGNIERCQKVAKTIMELGATPIAPQLFLWQYMSEESNEEQRKVMEACLRLVEKCDSLFVCYWDDMPNVSIGMREEIEHASKNNIPVVFFNMRQYSDQ